MDEVKKLLKPGLKKVAVAIIIWMLLSGLLGGLFATCFYSECVKNGELTACCSSSTGKILELLMKSYFALPFVAYVLSALYFRDKS